MQLSFYTRSKLNFIKLEIFTKLENKFSLLRFVIFMLEEYSFFFLYTIYSMAFEFAFLNFCLADLSLDQLSDCICTKIFRIDKINII